MENYCCKPADLNKLLKRFYTEFILKQARLGHKYKPDIRKVIYDDSFGQAFERQRITSLRENAQTKPCMFNTSMYIIAGKPGQVYPPRFH